jgi:hypothetical protein
MLWWRVIAMASGEQWNRYGNLPISVPLIPDTQSRRRLEPLLLLGPASSSEKRTVMTISLDVAEEFICVVLARTIIRLDL